MVKVKSYEIADWSRSGDKVSINLREGSCKLLTEYVRWQRTSMMGVVKPSKTRSDIVGSTRKLRRQKKTGRARIGSASSNILRGGYKAHGPTMRLPSLSLNKKVKRLAITTALSLKATADKLRWIGKEDLEGLNSTREYLNKFQSLRNDKVLFLTDSEPLGGRNVFNHKFTSRLGVYSILRYDYVVLDKEQLNLFHSV